MRYLLCRYGGMGDCLAITPVGAELHRRGHRVNLAVMEQQVPIFDNLIFYKVIATRRLPHPTQGVDCMKMRYGWGQIEAVKPRYDRCIDYKWSIERNSQYQNLPYGPWVQSMNSNYVNWVDMSFAWANIDPRTIPRRHKIPLYKVTKEERAWAKKLLQQVKKKKLLGIHLQASSLSRTWYYPNRLVEQMQKRFPDHAPFVYDNKGSWKVLTPSGEGTIGPLPVRQSFALIEHMDAIVCVDSAISHIAEALKTRHVTIYSTVPAWTRECYYKHSFPLEPEGLDCRPCFNLGRGCPKNQERANKSVTKREKEIERVMNERRGNLPLAAEDLDTTPDGLQGEIESAKRRIQAMQDGVPACIYAITADKILDRLEEAIGG